jgi:hypothetical protein
MKTAIQILDDAHLKEVGGGQSRIICTVSEEFITCTGNGVTVRTPRTNTGRGGGTGSGTGGGTGGGGNSNRDRGDIGGGRSGRRW